MYDYMRKKEDGDAEREQGIEIRRGASREVRQTTDQNAIEGEQEHDADESPFLGKSGENEIRLIFRKEPQFRLSSVTDTFSERFAAPDGDNGLIRVITRALHICRRIEKGEEAITLVFLKSPN